MLHAREVVLPEVRRRAGAHVDGRTGPQACVQQGRQGALRAACILSGHHVLACSDTQVGRCKAQGPATHSERAHAQLGCAELETASALEDSEAHW